MANATPSQYKRKEPLIPPAPNSPTTLAPDLVRVIAPNPSPMTYWGTNSYVLGGASLCVIDPGPAREDHLNALLAVIDGRLVSHIIVTHSHLDHSPLAGPLSRATGAPVYAFGPTGTGVSAAMQRLAASGYLGGGEGCDSGFVPDITLADGEEIAGEDWSLQVLHTPGHFGNHICLRWGADWFTGDHVMGWASSLVSPPDGDLTDFLASCARLQAHAPQRLFPGHGPVVEAGSERLDWLISHRLRREAEILAALQAAPMTPAELTARIYADQPPALLPMAERNVLAHLIDLTGKAKVQPEGEITANTRFSRR